MDHDRIEGYRRRKASVQRLGRLVAICGLLALGCCSNPRTPFPGLPRLSVGTQFDIQNLCDIGVSPKITLGKVPDGTTDYVVQMTNIDVLFQSPWRETIAVSSTSDIPEGAAKTYEGPCLGDNVRFPPIAPYGYRYRVEVLAQAADGKPLAYGATVVYVQSAYLTARRYRQRMQQGGAAAPSGAPPPGFPLDQNPAFPYGNFGSGTGNYGLMR
jgi:hypothetical protein